MKPAYVIKGVWAAILALAFVVLVALLAVQTARIDGFGIWPFKVKGYAEKLADAEAYVDRIEAAQDEALKRAVEARNKAEREYADLAGKVDDNANEQTAAWAGPIERFIAANRVRCPASAASGPIAPAEDHSTGSGQEASAAPLMDGVVVTPDDVRICTANTLQAEAARDWAMGLEHGL